MHFVTMKAFMLMMQNHKTACCHGHFDLVEACVMRRRVTANAVLVRVCPITVPSEEVLIRMCMCSDQLPFEYPVAYSTLMITSFTMSINYLDIRTNSAVVAWHD